MGHYSMTCSISGLPISGGTPVRCLLLTASPYDGDAREAWIVRTPPLRAVYNDYGSIENVHQDDKFIADLWLRGLKEDLIEKGLGDNSCHDVATAKDMTFEELLNALQEQRVEVRQDAEHFWRRPIDDSWLDKLEKKDLPLFQRIEKLVATIGEVSREASTDAYVVDEPVPNLVRVRFGQYSDKGRMAALERAKPVIEDAGFATTITAGSGRYADSADLLVFHAPKADGVSRGPQWDLASGQSAAGDKKLAVRLAMVREDVWQALIAFPHSQYVGVDCTNCGQQPCYHGENRECPTKSINGRPYKKHKRGSVYAHGPVFPADIEHVVYGENVWFGLSAFRASVRDAWKGILAHFDRQARIERGEKVEDESAEEKLDAKLDGLLTKLTAQRKKEEKRIAKLPKAEQDKIRAEREAAIERYEKARAERLAHPVFGDFLFTHGVLKHNYNDVAVGILLHTVPGVLGIPEHLSMCLADKVEVPSSVLDTIAELAAFMRAQRDVGRVWAPVASTGPQDPEWNAQLRFVEALANIARREQLKCEEAADQHVTTRRLPATIAEAIKLYK